MPDSRSGTSPLRVAIIGSGPSGLYAAEALTSQDDVEVSVDVLDRLPAPFGLARYGVAPDHLSLRSVRHTLAAVLDHSAVRLLANVEVGTDISVEELHRFYDAIVFTYGAATDQHLEIPGEDLAGTISATELVNWYCGHPDAAAERVEAAIMAATSAVVIGVGNVAVDVTRVLSKTAPELEHTDMPQHVLDLLATSSIRSVTVLGRRGPAQAAFTTKELRELGELADADVLVDPRDLALDPVSEADIEGERRRERNMQVLADWSTRAKGGGRRTIRLGFFSQPVEIIGRDRVTGVRVERTRLDADGSLGGTGDYTTIDADLVVRSVGYRGMPLAGVPFDTARGIIPHHEGRVLDDDAVVPGEYVAGWIKRGPTGIIGTNKKDATATVHSLIADAPRLPRAAQPDPDAVTTHLSDRGVRYVTVDGWRAIDAAEIALGESRGRARTTLHDRDALLESARWSERD
ncbi:NAD(P)-binding protein [Janibacter alittae]|uniref:NAD(P)-binding protein n=1 Tax=Janibacter alittae TaxID=3115209 RepID=A0ABZ2MGX9_9MICO